MSNFNADVDLQTLLDHATLGFLYTNVAGLSGFPDIRLKGGSKDAAAMVYGSIEIGLAKRGKSNPTRTHRTEFYLIDGTLRYTDLNDPPDRVICRLMMDEFERVLDKNSLTAANGYIYEFLDVTPIGPPANMRFDWTLEAQHYLQRADGT